LRRERRAKWLALLGQIAAEPPERFVIGRSRLFQPTASGRLHCFANDAPLAYRNNRGHVLLSIDEVGSADEASQVASPS
jgi:hypothetical protein